MIFIEGDRDALGAKAVLHAKESKDTERWQRSSWLLTTSGSWLSLGYRTEMHQRWGGCFWYLSTAMFVRVCACQGPSNRLISPQQRPPCARLSLVRSSGGTNQLLRERQHSPRWQEGNGIGVTCSVSHERVFPSPPALCIGLQPKCQMVGCCFDKRRQEDLFSLHGCVCLCNGQWGGFLFVLLSFHACLSL